MKKIIAITSMAMAISSAFAGDLSIKGDVGATSNEVYRGVSLSGKNPSANASVRADMDIGPVSVFGSVRGATINSGGVRGYARTEVGVGMNVLGVSTEAGLREHMFFAGTGSDLNAREAFVRGAMPVAGGVASAEYSKQVQGAEFRFGHPSYASVGYTHAIDGTPLVVGAHVGYAGYSTGHKFNDLTMTASYKLTEKVDIVGSQSIGGKDALGGSIPSQTSVGVRYSF